MTGLIHIYCGDGKGKTTASVGLAVRCAGRGNKVVFAQFLKGAPEAALRTAQALAKKKGVTLTGEALDTHAYKEQQYDKLADSVRKSLDMEQIYRIMEGKA